MKSEKAKEYLNSLPREVIRRHVGMPEAIEAVELAEQEAEKRTRGKAVEAFEKTIRAVLFIEDTDLARYKDVFTQKLTEE